MHVLYALWWEMHVVQTECETDGPSNEGTSGGWRAASGAASDVGVAAFSISAKHVWVVS